jgi:hypothetical protein
MNINTALIILVFLSIPILISLFLLLIGKETNQDRSNYETPGTIDNSKINYTGNGTVIRQEGLDQIRRH